MKLNELISRKYKTWYFNLFFSLLIAGFFFIIKDMSVLGDIELKTIDYRFRLFPIEAKTNKDIILIAIDNNSLEFAQQNRVFWPWPREFYALVNDYFTSQQAKAVMYDMQFYQPDYDRADLSSADSDQRFAEAIKNNERTILGIQLSPDKSKIPELVTKHSYQLNTTYPPTRTYHGLQAPIEQFLSVTGSLGVINIEPDRDGVIRRVPLFYLMEGKYYPQMSLSAWLMNNPPHSILLNENKAIINSKIIPLDKNSNYIINWYGDSDLGNTFKYITFSSVIQSAIAEQTGDKPTLPAGFFKNKYVIIGATANGLMDLKTSPYTKIMPGMEIWATVLSNLLNRNFIHIFPNYLLFIYLVLLVFCIAMVFLNVRANKANWLMTLFLILNIGLILFSWQHYRLLFNMSLSIIVIMFAYLYVITLSYLMEGKSKREIKKVFTRYLHPDVIRKLVENPDMIQMGGEEISATVLFTDIYNFTTFSEGKTPQELVSCLNEYFNDFTNSILDYHGLLDKYTGDGLMALFGVPISRKDHALLACRAAITQRRHAREIKLKGVLGNQSDFFHINTRIGINSGPIVAGNIGSTRRMDYTAIGDAVNLSARLEGVNKLYKTNIIISESTYTLVKDNFICRELDYLRVKGKTEPTRIYELVAEIGVDASADYSWIKEYEKSLVPYRTGDWDNAVSMFQKVYDTYQDQASLTMIKQCEYLVKHPPQNWDGILTLEVK